MNRLKYTLEQVAEIGNCKRAIKNAARKKKRRKDVRKILENIDEYAAQLQAFLLDENAEFSPGVLDKRREGTKNKEREICKPLFFPDLCAQWAVMQVVYPGLKKGFYQYSCASIPGRGTHYAKRSVERYFRRSSKNTKYCNQLDVKSFFASINKQKMADCIARRFKDKRLVKLLVKMLYAYKLKGIPIGWYISPALANLYLTPCDRYIKETLRIKNYTRYMDDMDIHHGSKRELHADRRLISEFLASKLGLQLKKNWQIFKMPYLRGKPPENYKERRRPLDFLGFKFYRYKTTIRKSIFIRILRLLRKLAKGQYTLKNAHAFVSYMGYIKATNSENVRRKYINGKIDIKKIKELIRNASRNYNAGGSAATAV